MTRFEVALLVAFAIACIAITQAKYGTGRYVGGGSCQRLPRPMSLSRFRSQVLGEGYTEIMYTSNEVPNFATIPYRFNHIMSQDTPEGELRQVFQAREFNDTSAGPCTISGVIPSTPLSSRYATFEQGENTMFAIGYRNFFFTSKPDNYLFEVFCNQTRGSNPRRQCCTGTHFVYLYTNNVPPHFLDWKSAARDLWRQMRISLSEFYFTFRFLVCPGAVP